MKKRILSLFLAITIIMSVFSIPSSAATKSENNGFNMKNGILAAFDGEWLYFGNDTQIRKLKNDGSKNLLVYTIEKDRTRGLDEIYVYDGYIYYSISSSGGLDGGIFKVKTDGKNNQVIYKSDDIICFQVVDGRAYFIEENNGSDNLCSIKLDGTGKKTHVKNVERSYYFYVSNGYIYYVQTKTVKVETWTERVSEWKRIKPDGTGKKTYSFDPYNDNIVVDNGNIYYIKNNKLFCQNSKGKVTEYEFDLDYNRFMGVYNDVAYYFEYDSKTKGYKLMQMNLDGSGKKSIAKLKTNYYSFNIQGNWRLYIDDDGAFYAQSLDGKLKKTLIKPDTTARTDIGL